MDALMRLDSSTSLRATIVCLSLAIALLTSATHAQTAIRVAQLPSPGLTDSGKYPEFTRLVRSGEALAKSGDYLGAIEQYDRALAQGAPTPLAHSALLTYRAGALWHLGRSREALADHNRAVTIDANAFALWARGETLRKVERHAEALQDYDAAIRLTPRDAPAHVGRGIALWRLGKVQEAQEAFDRAVTFRPDSHSLTNRATFFIDQKKLQAAIADYSRLIELEPAHVAAHVNRATAHAELGEYGKALDDFEAALRVRKDDLSVYRARGWVFERQGLLDRARADYSRGLELSPNDPWLRNALKNLTR